MSAARLLITGFEPFGGWLRNPSADLATALGRDAGLRRLGVRAAILPVHRHRAPAELLRLLRLHRPEALLLTGLAAGRPAACVERVALNCWRRAGDRGEGRRIEARGPDGLFATIPLEAVRRRLEESGVPAAISETAGTFCCNLVLYRALRWAGAGELPGGGPAPKSVGFLHVPATHGSLPPGASEPCVEHDALVRGVAAVARDLAGAGGRGRAGSTRARPEV